MYKMQLLAGGGTRMSASASCTPVEKLNESLKAHQLTEEAQVVTTGCFGFCEKGPIVKVDSGQHILHTGQTGRCRRDRRRTHPERKKSKPSVL